MYIDVRYGIDPFHWSKQLPYRYLAQYRNGLSAISNGYYLIFRAKSAGTALLLINTAIVLYLKKALDT